MREILFRAKTLKGEWRYGVPFEDYDENTLIGNYGSKTKVIPETVCQYTGLTDKNGTKIFEGDIVRNTDDNNIAVVSWYEEHAAFMLYSKKQNKIYFLYDNNFKLIEVIGNIHDNPELLKEDSK